MTDFEKSNDLNTLQVKSASFDYFLFYFDGYKEKDQIQDFYLNNILIFIWRFL